MFLRNIKDLKSFKEDVVYVWNNVLKYCFIVYEEKHEDWIISYIVNNIIYMSAIIDEKGKILYANGPLYEKMKEEGLNEKEIFISFMGVLEHHFDHLDHYIEKKDAL